MIFEERNKLFLLDKIFNRTTVLNIKVLHNNVKVLHKTWLKEKPKPKFRKTAKPLKHNYSYHDYFREGCPSGL